VIDYYFKIKHQTNYSERTVCIVESNLTSAKVELRRCYPNWNEVSVNYTLQNFESPTEKQLKYIAFIAEETGIEFTGITKKQASNYIQENKEKVSLSSKENTWSIVNGY
jgi:hypothetical protein